MLMKKKGRRMRRSRRIFLFITTVNKKNEYENTQYILFPSHIIFS